MGETPAILILAAFCQPIVIIFHEIAIYCADRGQNENCWGDPRSLPSPFARGRVREGVKGRDLRAACTIPSLSSKIPHPW
jgi:hypothetical protein